MFSRGGVHPISINVCLKVSCLMLVVWFGLICAVLLRFACIVVVLVFVVPRFHVCFDVRVYCWRAGVFIQRVHVCCGLRFYLCRDGVSVPRVHVCVFGFAFLFVL